MIFTVNFLSNRLKNRFLNQIHLKKHKLKAQSRKRLSIPPRFTWLVVSYKPSHFEEIHQWSPALFLYLHTVISDNLMSFTSICPQAVVNIGEQETSCGPILLGSNGLVGENCKQSRKKYQLSIGACRAGIIFLFSPFYISNANLTGW